MDKIKKQFKHFWQYFRLARYGANRYAANKTMRKWMPSMFIVIFALVFSFIQLGLQLDFYTGALIGSAIGMAVTASIKPSALSVAPFSPKQRIVFNLLSSLLITIIVGIAFTIVCGVFVLIVAFFSFCIHGTSIFESMTDPIMGYGVSGYGYAFFALAIVYFYFSTYAIFHLERTKNLTLASIVFFIVTEILTLVMTNLCALARVDVVHDKLVLLEEVPFMIKFLAHPWVPVLVLGILDAIAIGAAVFLTIRRFKSDKA